MYCINCGVKLSDTEKACPLCGTVPYHPDLVRADVIDLYPNSTYPQNRVSHIGFKVIVTAVFLISLAIAFLCDIEISGKVSWSAYAIGAILTVYICFVLPFWFKKPSPLIFVPISFLAVGVFVLFINLFTGGKWFLSFAFPVIGIIGLITTAVVALTTFLRRGRLYVFGGAIITLGGFMPLMELFLSITFGIKFIWWSLIPMSVLVILGVTVLFFAVCPAARESVERKFFL